MKVSGSAAEGCVMGVSVGTPGTSENRGSEKKEEAVTYIKIESKTSLS